MNARGSFGSWLNAALRSGYTDIACGLLNAYAKSKAEALIPTCKDQCP